MHCTKCGREILENAVFCKKCLSVMEQYPVKPGTVIQMPHRKPALPKKPMSRKKVLPPEEQVVRQRKLIKWLCIALVCTVLMLGLSVALLFHLSQQEEVTTTIGQNYTPRSL